MKYPLDHFSRVDQPVPLFDLRAFGVPRETITALQAMASRLSGAVRAISKGPEQ